MCSLVEKYNVPGPRYTSYPTVPYWDMGSFSGRQWKAGVRKSYMESNAQEGISLYIHLPFCESLCTFCGCHKRITKRHEMEAPYIRALLKEWDMYCELFPGRPVIKELHIGGGTPTFFSPDNLKRLLEGLFRKARRAEGHEFSFEGHPNNTTAGHLEILYNQGFTRVSFGVQDYSPEVQQAIHRVQSFEQVQEVTETARKMGYGSVGHDLIYGLPKQSVADIEDTIEKTKALRPDRIALYSYAHVPWKRGNGQRGFKDTDLPSPERKRRQYEIAKERLLEAGYVEIGMDHFALPHDHLYRAAEAGTLHRNFMGYTASKTQLLIGLGASSIGDSWYGYAQNVKSVEEYQHLVESGIMPIYRGHVLTQKDQIIRRHILNLMCGFETTWSDEALQFEELDMVLDRLDAMQSDGLVTIDGSGLRIHGKGKPFVRNICMMFDVYLHGAASDKKQFSMTV